MGFGQGQASRRFANITVFKLADHPPSPRYPNTPTPPQIARQRVQPVSRPINIFCRFRHIHIKDVTFVTHMSPVSPDRELNQRWKPTMGYRSKDVDDDNKTLSIFDTGVSLYAVPVG